MFRMKLIYWLNEIVREKPLVDMGSYRSVSCS